MPQLIVVGAGIVGAAIGYYAARRGAAVILVDQLSPASGATRSSFAWIGASGQWPDGAINLRGGVLPQWRRLAEQVTGVHVRWTGSLSWQAQGPGQIAVPAVDSVDDEVLSAAQVTSLRIVGARVVGTETSAGFLPADTVIAAAGTAVPRLCAPFEAQLPVVASPAALLRFQAPPGLVRTLIASPEVEARQSHDGHLLAAAECGADTSAEAMDRIAWRTARAITTTFRGAADIRLSAMHVGLRPIPADGTPIIGPVPGAQGLYVAVMHSGVTLAPLVGRLVAQEVVDGASADELTGCRPARFTVA